MRKVKEEMVRLALSITHLAWAASLLLDYELAEQVLASSILAVVHIYIGLLLIFSKTAGFGCLASASLLAYYWVYIKPLAPIAEPQSVGLIAVSLALIPYGRALRTFTSRIYVEGHDIAALLFRLGVAYPFMEWGLDAARNPAMFKHYILYHNPYTAALVNVLDVELLVSLIFLSETAVAIWLILGIMSRFAGTVSLLMLILFSLVVGYPLALPQDLALASASYVVASLGGGKYSLDSAITSLLSRICKIHPYG